MQLSGGHRGRYLFSALLSLLFLMSSVPQVDATEVNRATSARVLITGVELVWAAPGEDEAVLLVFRGRATLFNDGQERLPFRYDIPDGRPYMQFLAACGEGNLSGQVDFGPEAVVEDGVLLLRSGLRGLRCRQR